MGKIYVFDNNTGLEVPVKVNNKDVECLLGNSVSIIKSNIESDSDLFCVITPLQDVDFVVKTELEMRALKKVLDFGKYSYRVDFKNESIWYSDNVVTNIIVSSKFGVCGEELGSILGLYINGYNEIRTISTPKKKNDIYTVSSVRSGKQVIKTPNLDEAIRNCDQTPGTVVLNRDEEVVYRTKWGKVSVPYTPENHTTRHNAKLRSLNKKIDIKIK